MSVDQNTFNIPPMSATAFRLGKGHTAAITDVEGRQPGDLVAFRADDLSELFSQARTRVENGRTWVGAGDELWSNTETPRVMLRLLEGTAGRHSLLYSPCCLYAMEKRFEVSREGCREHLVKALAPYGITALTLPDPLSLFFDVTVDADGSMIMHAPPSAPGDQLILKAEFDCLIAVSTCSVPRANKILSGYQVVISVD